jgi:MraZ protein
VKKNNDFIRLFTSGVRSVEPDGNARVHIPKDLINYAGISKNIVLACVGSSLEIWDKEKYESAVNDASVDFAQLAEEVMGDQQKKKEDE